MLYVGKISTFGQLGELNLGVVARGLVIGAALMIGPFVTRSIVRRAHPRHYAIVIDLVLVVAAVGMFIATAAS